VLMSVIETCRRQTHSVVDYVSQTLRAFGNRLMLNLPKNCGHQVKGYSSFKEIPEWQKRDARSPASTSSRL
jgi:hypothetical protein